MTSEKIEIKTTLTGNKCEKDLSIMKLRQHKGGYDESMATTVEIEPTRQSLLQAIIDSGMIGIPEPLTEDQISVEPYKHDSRNGWYTHIVTIKNWGIYGLTDGPTQESKSYLSRQ
jgi:hypothetical protein